jgi:hypothetical protein
VDVWLPLETALGQWPDYEEELQGYIDNGPVQDYERGDERYRMTWVDRKSERLRVVDHWYKVKGKWYYTLYCGETELEYGESPFTDEKGQSCSKFELISYRNRPDGDRYSAFRDLKSPQDEVSQRRSRPLPVGVPAGDWTRARWTTSSCAARRRGRTTGSSRTPAKEFIFGDAIQGEGHEKANLEC